MARNVSSFSVKFNEWKYFGKDVTCTNMELGKTYSLAYPFFSWFTVVMRSAWMATARMCSRSFDRPRVVTITTSSMATSSATMTPAAYDYSSSKGCSQPMTWLVWVVVVVVVVIVIVVIVVLVMSNKKKGGCCGLR